MNWRTRFFQVGGSAYTRILKPLLFTMDPEYVHENMTRNGAFLGKFALVRRLTRSICGTPDPILQQELHGITYLSPFGLAAGFDYNAQLSFILPSLGFGFGTVGTITRYPYEGNPRPRLGRLPQSRSLMVNKGFKNPGSRAVIDVLEDKKFSYPVGVSIGRTNTASLSSLLDAINDVVACFANFEDSYMHHAYYELNISCPNLLVDISFYKSDALNTLLRSVCALQLKRPLYIKMPIDKTDTEFVRMLDVIMQYPVAGIIVGNLQKKRDVPELVPEEVAQFKVGNFSGKATWTRSNELIALAYKQAGKNLTVIGCGGVFSAQDAYTKIKLGASLVQYITGMIFNGPLLTAQMNMELAELLKQDGYKNVVEAVGVDSQA